MESKAMIQIKDEFYQSSHSSKYLDQIFGSMVKKNGSYESYDKLLNHAKKNRYCPQTTMILLQYGKAYINNIFSRELLFIIFDYAIQSNAFWPTCYSPSKELFIAPDVMQLDDCVVTIKQRDGDRNAAFQLNVKLNKKCNDFEILSHVNKMKQLFITSNNFPKTYPFKLKCGLGENNSCSYDLIVFKPKYLCPLPECSWIDDVHYYSFYYSSDLQIYRDEVFNTIPWTNLSIDTTEYKLEQVHFNKILDKQYLIFKALNNGNNYSKIQIFEISDDVWEDRETMKASLVQTIFMPFALEYHNRFINNQWQKNIPCANHEACKEIKFYKSGIFSPHGSFLFFNSILPKKNYSFIKKKDEQNYFYEFEKLQNETNRIKLLMESVEYKKAVKHYGFCDTLEVGGMLVGAISTLCFLGCCLYYLSHFAVNPMYKWTTSYILLASIAVVALESLYKTKLEKDFPGVAGVYERRNW